MTAQLTDKSDKNSTGMSRISKLVEPTIAFLLSGFAIVLSQKVLPSEYSGIAVASVLLWFPAILIFLKRTNVQEAGISDIRGRDIGYGIIISIPVLILYRLFLTCRGVPVINVFNGAGMEEGVTILYYLMAEAGAVAIPEEFFFRGYIQGGVSKKTGYPWWFSVIYSAALFAILHLAATGNLNRLLVFFPALLFGWMRHKTGNIGASVICHSLCNITHYLLTGALRV